MSTIQGIPAAWPEGSDAWLAAWLLPEAEAMNATGSSPSAKSGLAGRNCLCMAVARLLNRLASVLVTPVADGPSPCSQGGLGAQR